MKKYLFRLLEISLVTILISSILGSCASTGGDAISSASPSNSTNDTSIITDNFDVEKVVDNAKDDSETISEEEKQGEIGEGLLGGPGNKDLEYSGYLGCGYNLLESAYYNGEQAKVTDEMIDVDKLSANGFVYVDPVTSNKTNAHTFISDSTKEYSQSITTAAKVSGKFGLSGSFEASFDMSHDTEIKSNQKLITIQSLLKNQRDYIKGITNSELAGYATESFKEDVETLTPKELFDKYGTHVLKDIFMGGRFELNYIYTNKSNKSKEDIRISASASHSRVKGEASAKIDKDRAEVEENSEIHIAAYGGSITVDPTSIEKARDSYPEWARKVDEGYNTLIDSSQIVSMWDIVKYLKIDNAETKSKEIEEYFNSRSNEIAAEFQESVSVETYIESIHIGAGNTVFNAQNQLREQGVLEDNILNLDLNKGAGGDYIYVGYKTTTDKSKALRGIVANYFDKANSSNLNFEEVNYTIIKTDLNKGAKGKYIYLYYTYDAKAGEPITKLQYQENSTFQNGNADNYSVVRCTRDGKGLDLNKGASGAYIYLWFSRK